MEQPTKLDKHNIKVIEQFPIEILSLQFNGLLPGSSHMRM
jgi:hypothetical protein